MFVSIHHALSIKTDKKVVIKFVSTKYELYEQTLKGCEIARSFSHPNIINICDYFIFQDEVFDDLLVIIMDEYPDIDLLYYLRDNGPLSEIEAISIMKQLASALLQISSQGVIHCELTLENILIRRESDSNRGGSQFHVAVTGFTAAHKRNRHNSIVNNNIYTAPEFSSTQKTTILTDVYSLGIIFYQLLMGIYPGEHNQLMNFNNDSNEDELFSNISLDMKDLIKGMIDVNPNTRLTPNAIFNHPALNDINSNKIENRRSLIEFLTDIPLSDLYYEMTSIY